MTSPLCPCGSGAAFAACCRPILKGEPATTAEALMRSRYTAHVRRDDAYLLATWHPTTRPANGTSDHAQWRGLDVIDTNEGGADDSHGTVTFVAHWVDDDGHAESMRETSRFVRLDGRWVYLDGDID